MMKLLPTDIHVLSLDSVQEIGISYPQMDSRTPNCSSQLSSAKSYI
jgi:hypothetical protein